MKQLERIIQKAEKEIKIIGYNGVRNCGKTYRAAFEVSVRFTLENLWVPADEMLPEQNTNVIAWRKGQGIVVAKHDGEKWWWQDGFAVSGENHGGQTVYTSSVVVHDIEFWMPIPKLPNTTDDSQF